MDSNAGVRSNQEEVYEWDREAGGRFYFCLQRELCEKSDDEGKVILQELLDTAYASSIDQMLDYFFDDFMRLLGAECFLRLQEMCQDHRFLCALIRKIQAMCQGDCGAATLASLQCSAQQWTAFAVIIAALEEQDSHLVESTLEKQLPELQLMSEDPGEVWLSWLRFLCLRLLQDDRIEVMRTTVEYFLTHLNVEQLCILSLLSQFLVATNRSQLFDPEDENCIKEEHLKRFMADGNVKLLLETLVDLSWEDVPLLFWIRSLKTDQVKSVPQALFIQLCLHFRTLDNFYLRRGARNHVFRLFKDTIDGLSLRNYMICIESLFNKGDVFNDYDRLLDKISKCKDIEEHIDGFNRRSLEILTNCDKLSLFYWVVEIINILKLKMATLPKHKHGFWRLVLYTGILTEFEDSYRKFYNVDISLLKKGASLEKIQEHLLDRLNCQTSEETSFLKALCVDHFSLNLKSWRQLEELNLDPLELIEQGTNLTINHLAILLEAHEKRIKDVKILPALIARVSWYDDIEKILDYAYRNLTEKEYDSCITNLLLQKKLICLPNRKLSISVYIKLLLHGEPTRGLTRIEAACAYKLLGVIEPRARIRYRAIMHLHEYGSEEMKCTIFKELLKINEKLSIEHPHYTENSKVHRQKMRIASTLIEIRGSCDDPEPLKTLLLPSDHLGINLMHESLVGHCVNSIDWVLKALPSLQPRLQVSYLSVACIFILRNLGQLKADKLSEIFMSLLPLTMGSSYETRTFAQLILFNLALEFDASSVYIPGAEMLKDSFMVALGKQFDQIQNEFRLMFPKRRAESNTNEGRESYYVFPMTYTPFDETVGFDLCGKLRINLEDARQAFRARKLLSPTLFAPTNNGYK